MHDDERTFYVQADVSGDGGNDDEESHHHKHHHTHLNEKHKEEKDMSALGAEMLAGLALTNQNRGNNNGGLLGGEGGLLGGLVLASLLGRGGLGGLGGIGGAACGVGGEGWAGRGDRGAETRIELNEDIQGVEDQLRDIQREACEAGKDAIREAAAIREEIQASGRETDDLFCELEKTIGNKSERITDLLFAKTIADDKSFAALSRQIGDDFCSLEKRQLQDKFELSKAIDHVALESEKSHERLHVHIERKTDEILKTLADKERRELELELAELRADGRKRETELNISQTVITNQQQAQAQVQTQAQNAQFLGILQGLAAEIQNIKATQATVNFGTMTGTVQSSSAANNSVR